MKRALGGLILVLVLASNSADAQNGGQFAAWHSISNIKVRPEIACAHLSAPPGTKILVAEHRPSHKPLPAFCHVVGAIAPALRFAVDLPDAWNGRLYVPGNGAFAGEALDDPQMLEARDSALSHGFAVAYSNAGHDAKSEPLATFARDNRKLVQFAYLSTHLTAVAARSLIAAYYSRNMVRAYFDGCSTGGRQALVEAQRFPLDFDGILAGAPIADYVGTMMSTVWIERSLRSTRLPASKLPLVAKYAYARCDKRDGLADGIIDDPRTCDFDPRRDVPACVADRDGPACLTKSQSVALATIYADVQGGGRTLFPGWPTGGEAVGDNPFTGGRAPGWVPMIVNDRGTSWAWDITKAFFEDIAHFSKANFKPNDFDFDRDPPRLQKWRALLDATNPDLSSFYAHGGKLIIYAGWADPALNPKMSVNYFHAVAAKMKAYTSEFVRLYMVPGMFHCTGGVGPNRFDAMTPLMSWVELKRPPQAIQAFEIDSGKIRRSRPLCPYPQVARLRSGGHPNVSADFACRERS